MLKPHIRCKCYSLHKAYIWSKNSPTCANYALRRTAVDNQDRYPETAYAVLEVFYMDDYLGSVKNPETSLRLSRSLVELTDLGVSNLAEFISNIPMLSLKVNPSKTSASNSKEILTAAINPETASHVLDSVSNKTTSSLRCL